jgi:hypothetical protein
LITKTSWWACITTCATGTIDTPSIAGLLKWRVLRDDIFLLRMALLSHHQC